jgi:hypothetical protein
MKNTDTIDKMIRMMDNEDIDLIDVLVIERRHNAVELRCIVLQRSESPNTWVHYVQLCMDNEDMF